VVFRKEGWKHKPGHDEAIQDLSSIFGGLSGGSHLQKISKKGQRKWRKRECLGKQQPKSVRKESNFIGRGGGKVSFLPSRPNSKTEETGKLVNGCHRVGGGGTNVKTTLPSDHSGATLRRVVAVLGNGVLRSREGEREKTHRCVRAQNNLIGSLINTSWLHDHKPSTR